MKHGLLLVQNAGRSLGWFCHWPSSKSATISKTSLVQEAIIEAFRCQMTGDRSVIQLNKIVHDIEEQIPKFSAQSIARLTQLCKTGSYSNPNLTSRLLDAARKLTLHGDGFDCFNTAMMIQSLAYLQKQAGLSYDSTLRLKIQKVALQLLTRLSKEQKLTECTNRSLSNTFYGTGILFKRDRNEHARNAALEFCLRALSNELTREHRLRQYSQQTLSNVVFALGCLGWKKHNLLLALSHQIIRKIREFSCMGISSLLLSIANLRFHHEGLIIALGVEAARVQRAPKFNEQEFCNVLHGLARLIGQKPELIKNMEPAFNGLFYEAGTAPRLAKYNLQDICTLLYSISMLSREDYASQNPWIRQLFGSLVDKFCSVKSPDARHRYRYCINALYSCARLNYYHQPLIDFVYGALRQKRLRLDHLRTVSLLLWTLTVLKCLKKDVFWMLTEQTLVLQQQGFSLTNRNWFQLSQAQNYLKLTDDDRASMKPEIIELLQEARHTVKRLRSESLQPTSEDQLDLQDTD